MSSLELFVPGRVCLFGEHSDWAGSFRRFNSDITRGYTIVCGTNQGIHARCCSHPDKLVLKTLHSDGVTVIEKVLDMDLPALLREAQSGEFWSYAAGVAYKIATDYRVGGLVIDNYKTTLPMSKGLSSSAAYCVLIARAFSAIYDLKMTTRGEMEYAYQGEITTPSRCGRMDQACAYGSRPVILTYDGDLVEVTELRVGSPLHIVIVDLSARKSTTQILADLQSAYPFPQTDEQRAVVDCLGPSNERLCLAAVDAIGEGNVVRVGQLMMEAQKVFDAAGGPISPTELVAPVLHRVLAHAPLQPLIHGRKGVGSGGDGTAQFLCKGAAEAAEVVEIFKRDFPDMFTLPLVISGGSQVRRAVIPAAGFNGGLFPATKAVKANLFPILDGGVTKPAILINIEEAVEAGIEQVIVVVQPEDLSIYSRLFHEKLSPENFHRLSDAAQRYAKRINDIGTKVKLVVQPAQEGLGHALLTCRELLGDEPFLLMLGHHLYRSTRRDGASCTAQLLAYFAHHSMPSIALQRTAEDQVHHYGCITGVWDDKGIDLEDAAGSAGGGKKKRESFTGTMGIDDDADGETMKRCLAAAEQLRAAVDELEVVPTDLRLAVEKARSVLELSVSEQSLPRSLSVTKIVEKPTLEEAKESLTVPGEKHFLTAFGMYVMPSSLLEIIAHNVSHNKRDSKGRFGITNAMDQLRRENGVNGFVVNGERFDLGTPLHFLETSKNFSTRT
jgi:UTP-glucose-1-phosphate uridylyltransferase/mevalonate kinase